MLEVIEWHPTPDIRWYIKSSRYMPTKVLQRKFVCEFSNGMTLDTWAQVHESSPFVRVKHEK